MRSSEQLCDWPWPGGELDVSADRRVPCVPSGACGRWLRAWLLRGARPAPLRHLRRPCRTRRLFRGLLHLHHVDERRKLIVSDSGNTVAATVTAPRWRSSSSTAARHGERRDETGGAKGTRTLTPTLPVWCATSCAIAPSRAHRSYTTGNRPSKLLLRLPHRPPGPRPNRAPDGSVSESPRRAPNRPRRSARRCR